MIAVKSSLISSNILLDGVNHVEYVCIKIQLNSNSNVFIYAAYIPPNSPASIYDDHAKAINQIQMGPNDFFIVQGDFNIPHSNWILDDADQNVLLPANIKPLHAETFIDSVLQLGLHQINSIRNPNGKLLDLIFTNDFENAEISCPPPLSKIDEEYHPPILLSYEWHFKSCDDSPVKKRNFNRANYIGMNNFFAEIDFTEKYNGKSLDQKVEIFHEIIAEAIDKFVPFQLEKAHSKMPWRNRQLSNLKNIRNREWIKSKNSDDKSKFEKAYQEFDNLNSKLYEEYIDKMASSIKSDPSSFWQFVNSKKDISANPKLLKLGDRSTTNGQEQANLFAEFFSSNFNSDDNSTNQQSSSSSNSQIPNSNNEQTSNSQNNEPLMLSEHFVFDELMHINTKKGVGPDGIHPMLLKNCAAIIYQPLTVIFNESLSTGNFPTKWKRYSVKPIFKKGSRTNVENYRCIAKLPTVAKFFEFMINKKLLLIVGKKIISEQHGFTKKRSTVTNLMDFVHFCLNGMKKGTQVDVLYTDFSKAFDRVNHKILLSKLAKYNLPPNL